MQSIVWSLMLLEGVARALAQSVSVSVSVQNVHQVYRNSSVANNNNSSSLFWTNSESDCALRCANPKAKARLLGCVAASYDWSSGVCSYVTNASQMQLYASPLANAYVQLGLSTSTLAPSLWFPLSQGVGFNFSSNFGSAKVSSPVTLIGLNSTTSFNVSSAPRLATTLWFPQASTIGFTRYALVQDTSTEKNLHIFGGSFTVSFMVVTHQPDVVDMPVMQFLGDQTGQACVTLRMGASGKAINLNYRINCNCSLTFNVALMANMSSAMTSWTHYAVSYNNETSTVETYFNGILNAKSNDLLSPPLLTVTRLLIGASECNSRSSFILTYSGSIACIQLFKQALNADQVNLAYKQCKTG